jgi:His-Xaa-Ser system protein HxsD
LSSEVRFDLTVYSLDAVKAACYRFLDKFSASIGVHEGVAVCGLQFDSIAMSDAAIAAEIENLKKEVLDQDLRQKLKRETEPVRNLILAHAFSKTGLIADE